MNRYQPSAPRAAFAAAAIALTVLTVGIAVIAPAKIDSRETAATFAARSAPTEVAIIPGRIDVIGRPEKSIAVEAGHAVPAKRAGEAS